MYSKNWGPSISTKPNSIDTTMGLVMMSDGILSDDENTILVRHRF
jgi:hypothetical protein